MAEPQMSAETNVAESGLLEQISATEAELHKLEVEREQLPGQIQRAAQDADAEALAALRRRVDDLPLHIFATRAWLLRLKITRTESELPEAEAEFQAANTSLAPISERLQALRAEYDAAVSRQSRAKSRRHDLQTHAGELKRELQQLMLAQNVVAAPVPRSAIQTARSLFLKPPRV